MAYSRLCDTHRLLLEYHDKKSAVTALLVPPLDIELPSSITLLEGDVFDQLQHINDGSIDTLITDPPYLVMNDYEWDKQSVGFTERWVSAVIPKLKPAFNLFIFCDARLQYEFETVLRKHFTIKNRLIWVRKNMSMGRVVKDRFISSYEVIFFCGNKSLNLPAQWGAERFDSQAIRHA